MNKQVPAESKGSDTKASDTKASSDARKNGITDIVKVSIVFEEPDRKKGIVFGEPDRERQLEWTAQSVWTATTKESIVVTEVENGDKKGPLSFQWYIIFLTIDFIP